MILPEAVCHLDISKNVGLSLQTRVIINNHSSVYVLAHPDKKPFFGRYIGWKTRTHLTRCQSGHYVHNICVFGVRDLPLLKQRYELIANKFDIDYDPIVYMCMEEWIQNKTLNVEDISDSRRYRKLAALQV